MICPTLTQVALGQADYEFQVPPTESPEYTIIYSYEYYSVASDGCSQEFALYTEAGTEIPVPTGLALDDEGSLGIDPMLPMDYELKIGISYEDESLYFTEVFKVSITCKPITL